MKNFLFAISIILMFQNCHFKLKVKEAYYSQDELVNYAKEKNYLFDLILRYKDYENFTQRKNDHLERINFMNLYSKDNYLIKKTDGENCEFRLANFIKDSIDNSIYEKNSDFSLNRILEKSEIINVKEPVDLLTTKYKILVGWSISLNQYKIVNNRLKLLNETLSNLGKDFIIVGFNMDIPKKKL